MSAVLACGPDALLSHRTAADHLGILPMHASRIEVTAPGRTRHGSKGLVLHLPRHLRPEDRTVKDAVPVTSVARTLVDLAGVVPARRLRRAVEGAERLQLLDLATLGPLLVSRRPGIRALRAVLRSYTEPPITRSELERRFLDFCHDFRLPPPQANQLVNGMEVDMLWRHERLVVELDSHAHHGTRMAFEEDRKRDATLQLAGYRVVRVTHQRLQDEAAAVAGLVRTLLSRLPERRGGAPVAGARARPGGPAS